jgi:ABC-2 type transport system permease protein
MIAQWRSMWLVMRREVRERVRGRVFVLATLFVAVLAAGGVVAADKVPSMLEEGPQQVGIVGTAPAGLDAALAQVERSTGTKIETRTYADQASAEAALRDGETKAILVDGSEIVFDKKVDDKLSLTLNQAVQIASLPARLDALGLSPDQLRPILQPDPLATTLLSAPASQATPPSKDAQSLAYGGVILLMLALTMYGQWILMGVIEEKTNRIVEVLLGALRPVDLLVGKVAGILVLAMTQLGIAIAAGLAALVAVGVPAHIPDATPQAVATAVIWFLLGLTFFSFAYAAVGATVSRQEQASTAAGPIAVVIIVTFLLSVSLLEQPDSPILRILSLVPVTAPFLMPERAAIGSPPLIDAVAAVVLMLAAIVVMARVSGRIYSGGILRSGPSIRLLDAWRSSDETAES